MVYLELYQEVLRTGHDARLDENASVPRRSPRHDPNYQRPYEYARFEKVEFELDRDGLNHVFSDRRGKES